MTGPVIVLGGLVLLLWVLAQAKTDDTPVNFGKGAVVDRVMKWYPIVYSTVAGTINGNVKTYTAFCLAVMHWESGGQETIRGPVGEYGLMQVLCSTAREPYVLPWLTNCDQLLDGKTNILAGVRYIEWLRANYAGHDKARIASKYNGGPGMEPDRNPTYVNGVMSLYEGTYRPVIYELLQ